MEKSVSSWLPFGGGGIAIITALGVTLAAGILGRWRSSRSWGRLRNELKRLDGKVIIVTGANSGLGFKTALELARRNATVILACRNPSTGDEAARRIQSKTNNLNVFCIQLDLESLASVREFAERVKSSYPKIYCIVCNAGVWIPMAENRRTEDDFEIHFGVNHLAHFYLTRLLFENLKAEYSSKPRIVYVSSSLMNGGILDMESEDFVRSGRPQPRKGHAPSGYMDSKLMNALISAEWAKRLQGVESYAVCPGWCYTNLNREVKTPWYVKCLLIPIALIFMRTAAQGAQNILHCVLEDDLINGAFYRECQIPERETKKIQELSETGTQLWTLSEELLDL